jgi:hypothetical protein
MCESRSMNSAAQISDLKLALSNAFAQGSTLLGSYLDNVGAYHYAVLTVLWQDFGTCEDSILSFAEKIRKGQAVGFRQTAK